MKERTIWIAAFAAPLAWFVDLVLSYATTPPAYHPGRVTISTAAMVGSAAIAVLSSIVLALFLRRSHVWESRMRFVARAGLWISLLSLLLVIGMEIPNLILPPGAEP